MTNDQIKEIALANGFKLKEQPSGEMDLNPYVYKFARKLLSHQTEVLAQTVNDHWCMTDDGEARKRDVLNSILDEMREIKDKLSEAVDD